MPDSEWTIATLKELFDRTIEDRDARVNLAMSSAKEAVAKAETADDKRFTLINEFRGQQQDMISKFATREFVDQAVISSDRRVSAVESGLATLQGRALALGVIGTVFGGVVGGIVTGLVMKLVH